MKEIGYSKSTYWHDLYRKIQVDTHWTDTQMGDNLPDVCKLREQETIDNLTKDGALTVAKSVMDIDKGKTPTIVQCPCCDKNNSLNKWYSTSNDYHAICPSCTNVIQYYELPKEHAEKIRDC